MAAVRGARSGTVNDLVLLDRIDEGSILECLGKRHGADEIYTYIGETLISVNPYKQIGGLYGNNVMRNYVGKKDYQNQPHPYATAERAYRSMTLAASNECIVITGESGAGKTEASKVCMNYIAFLASKSKHVQRVKEQLLETNPLLEAFGNAKTRRNDNSSRFGKYFEILFMVNDPEGGRISQFLLEKNRVTYQQQGERNFHVFYQIMTDSSLRRELNLSANHAEYKYFCDPASVSLKTVDDANDLGETRKAMQWVGIPSQDQSAVFRVIGGILHLGNIDFRTGKSTVRGGTAEVNNSNAARSAAELLGCSEQELCAALTHKTVRSGIESVRTDLNVQMAAYARDALAKSLYGKVFEFIVQRANETIRCDRYSTSIGVLDIYGFEILGVNGFEQLCINHTNERLHQLFIELTLRREQEEYAREGIAWSKIEFFDNLPICNLIEKNNNGLYALIDEESIFPNGSDASLMKKLLSNVRGEKFFEPSAKQSHAQFHVKHYAGTVTYDTNGFLDSNKDTLNLDLVQLCNNSRNHVVRALMQDHPSVNQKTMQRPPTTCQQYKKQVFDLMSTLKSCNQHYIRCIKPNDQKRSGVFQQDMTVEQVRYLGLLENVKVRRAGYAFRMDFTEFIAKYKTCMSGHPEYEPNARKGVEQILRDNGATKGFEMGKTKVFIKDAKPILAIEDRRKAFLDECATLMPKDDGVIWADKVMGFDKKFNRTQLNFIVGQNGFYWFSKAGTLEHFIKTEKCEVLVFDETQGWMVVCSTYPGKKPEDPPVQLSYLSENIYASEVKNVVELVGRMGYQIEITKSSNIPNDARDPAQYKANVKMIQRGAMEGPAAGKKKACAPCVIS